jgi:hypothetical protein
MIQIDKSLSLCIVIVPSFFLALAPCVESGFIIYSSQQQNKTRTQPHHQPKPMAMAAPNKCLIKEDLTK